MKTSERKIKQAMPREAMPTYLRLLADALERKTVDLPDEMNDLPEPIAKLELKGKLRGNAWELKIKIKAEEPSVAEQMAAPAAATSETAKAGKPQTKYKHLKKKMKSSFKDIGESLTAQKLPEPEVLNAFLAQSDLMMAFSGDKYGESQYSTYRDACSQLAQACEAQNWEAFKSAYANLDQLKKDCHNKYK
ncbi:MAG: GAK system XXXCH domain-containing protein [Desulfobacterales bacterium]|jgi:XXXCH domain-containing protein